MCPSRLYPLTSITSAGFVLVLAIVGQSSVANAQSTDATTRIQVDLTPTFDASIIDNSPFDGLPEAFEADLAGDVQLNSAFHDSRTIIEFDLNALPPGARIRQAQLRAPVVGKAVGPDATSLPVEVRAFRSNGVVNLSDFHQGRFEGVFDALLIPPNGTTAKVDVTPMVEEIYENSSRRLVGFVLRTTAQGGITVGSLETGKPAILRIVYTIRQ
jgi:hypothetical protein